VSLIYQFLAAWRCYYSYKGEVMSEVKHITPDLDNQNVDDLVSNILGGIPKVEYSEVKLPSLATALYGLETPYLHVRPMTFADEKAVAAAKKKEGMDILLSRCVEENINPKNLLMQDKLAILFHLRAISVGNEYSFNITCNQCESINENVVDIINTFPCKYAEEPVERTVKLKLPESGKEVVIRRASSSDLEQDQMKILNELWRFMIEIEGITNAKVRAQVIDYLPRKDVHFIIKHVTLSDIGIDQKFLFVCANCGHQELEELKLTSDFFTMK